MSSVSPDPTETSSPLVDRDPVVNALVFFRSVILANEAWSTDCERAYNKAIKAWEKHSKNDLPTVQ